jgi:3-deoxy-7-phosphoheptulonate synthase
MDDDNGGRPSIPAQTPALKGLRDTLDSIDHDLVQLIARRMQTVAQVIKEKQVQGKSGGIRDAKREHDILGRVEGLARAAGISAALARKIFSELLAHSVSRQANTLTNLAEQAGRELVVAYQGSPYTYAHLAAVKYMADVGAPGTPIGKSSTAEIVAALHSGAADLALLAIESTAAGSINQVYDVLREQDLHVVGEETIKVDLCLCGIAEVPLRAIAVVLSHPLALEQCSLFVDALPHARTQPTVDTAEAMRLVADAQDPTHVAVGSPEAAESFGLVVVRRGIGNHEEIHHRYVVLAKSPIAFDERIPCKTSLIVTTRHEQGALLRCLQVLSDHGFSLTKLESRPHPDRPWEYMFFIDFEGNVANARVAAALDELRTRALFLKVLGCYPAKATPMEAHATAVKGSPVESPPPAPATAAAPAARRSPTPYKLIDRAARSEDTVVRVGNLLIGGPGFVVMAGPSLVESEAQIVDIARFVRDHGAHVLRGGAGRRSPGAQTSQGLSGEALELLAAAGRMAGMPVVTEVLSSEEVRPAAERADILQVGGRNMQSFALLREVGKVNRPVLLERAPAATLDEWLAAAEFVLAQGNGQVILCERGIRTFESGHTLDLSAVVALRERTHLPVIVDPSDGNGRHAAPLAWAARACGAHGLLIDVHSGQDGEPSVSFAEFTALMQGLERWRA